MSHTQRYPSRSAARLHSSILDRQRRRWIHGAPFAPAPRAMYRNGVAVCVVMWMSARGGWILCSLLVSVVPADAGLKLLPSFGIININRFHRP